jgi:LemA protein
MSYLMRSFQLFLERISKISRRLAGQNFLGTAFSVKKVLDGPFGPPPGLFALRPGRRKFCLGNPLGIFLRCALVLSLTLFAGCGYNSLQRLDEEVKASWAQVENQYQRRHDLIPNLVETVKGYAKHEKETLEGVMAARAKATQVTVNADSLTDPQAIKRLQQAEGTLTQALSRLMVVAERYPDLKANQNFRELQAQLEGTENRIAVARKNYIDKVTDYNSQIRAFPTNLTAKYLLGLKVRETFTIAEETKAVPNVKF